MRQGRQYGVSAEHRVEILGRWKAGESLHEIGHALGNDHGSIQFVLSTHSRIARQCVVVGREPSRRPSGKTSQEALLPECRFRR